MTLIAVVASTMFLSGCGGDWAALGSSAKAPDRTYIASFFDSKTGIAVGASGLVRHTVDGGATWVEGSNSSMCLFACQAIDGTNCVASGNGNDVVVSSDGGKNWRHAADIVGRGKALSFADSQAGWACSKTWLGETVDGGSVWKAMQLPSGVKILETAFMESPGVGYIVASDGVVYRTSTGGKEWERLAAPFPAGIPSFAPKYASENQCVALCTSNGMLIAASIGTAGKAYELRVRSSADSGKTWSNAERHPIKKPVLSMTMGRTGIITVFDIDLVATVYGR
jgi:photosystem II stability/assembly factor-like uncharacterized protein